MTNKSKINKHTFLIGTLIFLFIYMPPLFVGNMLHFISLISWAGIVLKYRSKAWRLIKNKSIFLFFTGIVFSCVLLTVTILFTTGNFDYLKSLVIIVIEVLPSIFFITILFKHYGYDLEDICRMLLNVALAQSIISLLTFLFPEFKDFILNRFYYDEFVIGADSYLAKDRIYGLADNFTFTMPVVQGFMAIVAFAYSLKKSLKYFIYIPFLLFSAAINARTGILIFFIGCLVFVAFNLKEFKIARIIKITIVILIIVLSIPMFLSIIESGSKTTAEWVAGVYFETKALFEGEKVGYYSVLEEVFFIPESDVILVGTGEDRFGKFDKGSDVGYVNDLFLGGIFFTIILYSTFLLFFAKNIWNKEVWQYRNFSILMIILMIILNVKGMAFRFNDFTNLFLLISVVFIHYLQTDKEIVKSKKSA